ncbi:reverse transcriptase domain, reverse transcriptase zinc-binding domain protein [Tanacetum coccineum]
MKRGLRQGDPLSPFLFLIVAEALQVLTLEACSRRLYNKFSLANDGSNISLLQFENDALFFGEWSSINAINLVRMLKCFNDASSLKVNLSKSRIYGVGVPILEVNQVVNTIKCLYDNLTFLYLGLPVGKYMRLGERWSNMTDSFVRRLSSWKAKLLSIGGRLSLVKAVLVSLPLYFLSVFRAANQVLNKLELIRCRFFWGFKDDSSDKVAKCSEKQISRRSGCRLIPCKKFSSYGGIGVARVLRSRSSVWQNILRSIEEIKKIGVPLDSLMTRKIISAWRSPPWGHVDSDLHSLEHLLSGLSLQPEKDDAWAWNVDISGKFSVKCFSDLVQSKLLAESNLESWWNIRPPDDFSLDDILSRKINLPFTNRRVVKALFGVCYVLLWSIWKWRNKILHATHDELEKANHEDIFSSVHTLSLLWLKNRSACSSLNWDNWVQKPYSMGDSLLAVFFSCFGDLLLFQLFRLLLVAS